MNSPHDNLRKSEPATSETTLPHLKTGNFNLLQSLEKLRHKLPAQAPIKDFVHHNTLHAFQDLSFESAVEEASFLFEANAYLPIDEYRNNSKQSNLKREDLQTEIRRSMPASLCNQSFFENKIKGEEIIQYALNQYQEYLDSAFAKFVLQKEGISANDFEKVKLALIPLIPESRPKIRFPRSNLIIHKNIDLNQMVHPVLIRLIGSYLDQGICQWSFPERQQGFYQAVLNLICKSHFPLAPFVNRDKLEDLMQMNATMASDKLLAKLCPSEYQREDYLRECLYSLPGWSGMVSFLEENSSSLLENRKVELIDFVAVKLLLENEALNTKIGIKKLGVKFSPERRSTQAIQRQLVATSVLFLKLGIKDHQILQLPITEKDLLRNLLRYISKNSLSGIWHRASEHRLYNACLNALAANVQRNTQSHLQNQCPEITAVFCIDDRECSLRRYLEQEDPGISTESTAGFFGVDFYFQSIYDANPVKLCPLPIQPRHVVREIHSKSKEISLKRKTKGRFLTHWHELASSVSLGWLFVILSAPWVFISLILRTYKPTFLSRRFRRLIIHQESELDFIRSEDSLSESILLQGYTYNEMADRVEAQLRSTGISNKLGSLIVFIAHGSSSMNNPHFSAYDCGACSGRPGAANARTFALMANLLPVRNILNSRGLNIPSHTKFIGGFHDTCKDECIFFDEHLLEATQRLVLVRFKFALSNALLKNSKERARRFENIPLKTSKNKAHHETLKRSFALFEPRPELNHATNSICVVGRRSLTQNLFLDRRAFLQSYDASIDPTGAYLEKLLSAVVPVCAGINLEYLFSRIDNEVYGSGTKLPHNVASLLGVMNGVDDDLRTGLPKQMVEIHDPIRCLFVVERSASSIQEILNVNPAIKVWFENRWAFLFAIDPITQEMSQYEPSKGFTPFQFSSIPIQTIYDVQDYVSQSRGNLDFALITPMKG